MKDPFRGSRTNEQFLREAKIGLFVIGLFICFFAYIIYVRIGQFELQVPESVRNAPPSQLIDPELVRQKMYSQAPQPIDPPGQTMALGRPLPDDAPEPDGRADSNYRETRPQVAVPENGSFDQVEPIRPPKFLPQSIHAADPHDKNGTDTSSTMPFEEMKSTVANLRESLNQARRQLPSSEAIAAETRPTSPQTPPRDQIQPPPHQSSTASPLSEIPIREIQNRHGQPVTRDIADCPTRAPTSQTVFAASPLRSADPAPARSEEMKFQPEPGEIALISGETPAGLTERSFPAASIPTSQDFVLHSSPDDPSHVEPTQLRPAQLAPVDSGPSESLRDPDASNGASESSIFEDSMPKDSGASGSGFSSFPSGGSSLGSRTELSPNEGADPNAFQRRTPKPGSNVPQPQTARFGQHDSWWTVAERHYGDGRLFRALYAYNAALGGGPDDERRIGSGEETGASEEADRIIQIPELSRLISMVPDQVPADLRVASPTTSDAAASGVDAEYRSAADATSTYRTRRGDTLFDIARRQLGQASRYVELYELNRDRLPDSLTHLSSLPADMELRLPRR